MINRLRCLFLVVLLAGLCGCSRETALIGDNYGPLSCDVAVVGHTEAALMAALEASRQGAAVVVCYDEEYLDPWIWREGVLAVLDGEEEAEQHKAEVRAALYHYGGNWGKSWHHNLLAAQAGPSLEWLCAETGLTLEPERPGLYRLTGVEPQEIYARLRRAAELEGVRFLAKTQVTEIRFDDAGEVSGITIQDAAQKEREIFAPSVILADGNFLHNEQLMRETTPGVEPASWRPAGSGHGLQLAIAANLDLVHLDRFVYYPAVPEGNKWIAADIPGSTLLILDQQLIPLTGKNTADLTQLLIESSAPSGLLLVAESQLDQEVLDSNNWLRYAGIRAFMEEWALDIPLLSRWYRRPDGYFRGTVIKAVAQYCLGGIAIDETGQALSGDEPVMGLFAAGEITGGLHGRDLPPGAALTEALVLGRATGGNAAAWAMR